MAHPPGTQQEPPRVREPDSPGPAPPRGELTSRGGIRERPAPCAFAPKGTTCFAHPLAARWDHGARQVPAPGAADLPGAPAGDSRGRAGSSAGAPVAMVTAREMRSRRVGSWGAGTADTPPGHPTPYAHHFPSQPHATRVHPLNPLGAGHPEMRCWIRPPRSSSPRTRSRLWLLSLCDPLRRPTSWGRFREGVASWARTPRPEGHRTAPGHPPPSTPPGAPRHLHPRGPRAGAAKAQRAVSPGVRPRRPCSGGASRS